MNSVKNVKFVDVPVDCYYPAFKKDKTLCYEYYRSFLINDDIYETGDFAVINGTEDFEVVKLICIYTTYERKVEIVVRKYLFARNLRDKLRKEGFTEFDSDNEVVEDFTKDYIIKPEQIIRKCHLIIAQKNDNTYIVKESQLDPLLYFSCRYTLKPDGSTDQKTDPLSSTPSFILGENNLKSPSANLGSAKNQKRKFGSENVPLTSFKDLDDLDSKIIQNRRKSPKNPHKTIKMSECSTNVSSPIQRNLVKRNLNESFGNSPNEKNYSILDYSIVSDEDIDSPFVLKLKISENNRMPIVVLKKYNEDSYQVKLRKKKNQEMIENSPVRKSTRVKERKSYADYISPIKSTSIKGGVRKVSETKEIFPENITVKNSSKEQAMKRDKHWETPTKIKSEEILLEKRVIKTPKRYQDDVESPYIKKLNLESSVRRSLRQTERQKEVGEVVASPRSNRKIKRQKSISTDDEENKITISGTPEKKINLDDSIRRSVLRVRLNIEDLSLKDKKASIESGDTAKSKQLERASRKFYFESSSEDEEETISKSKTVERTPRTRRTTRAHSQASLIDSENEHYSEIIHKTPNTRKNIGTPKSTIKQIPKTIVNQTPKTPRNRAKLIRDGVITPSMHSRTKAVVEASTPLMKARSQLHVSYVPTALPCREKEYCDVFNFLEGKLLDGCGGCMYISGVPGTGKTATITSVINNLLESDDVPKFSYVNINGMRMTEPRQSYVEILKQLSGKTVPWEQAQSMLEERFTKSKKLPPVVMLIDELDILCTKRQDVVYNLLDWPTKAKNQLIVVTIANTMDLPERLLMNRVTSRLGLTRLTFQAYTHKQLQEIVTKRLSGTNSFNPDAIQFVARKVASVSGDARRALDICRRAAEIAETEGKSQLVNMNHVNEALNAMITQPKVRAIKNCSRLEQLILQSIVAEVERTGVEETTFVDVFKMLVSCTAIDGFRMVSSTTTLSAVSRLSACRLILTDHKCNDINQRIILNVSVDDVYYALKRD